MKKLLLFLLCNISCVYHLQSMEVIPQQTDSLSEQLCYNNSINNNSPRFETIKCGGRGKIEVTKDKLSEKLYNYDLTKNEITELVRQGANVNYKGSNGHAIPLHFVLNTNEHAIENMKTIIEFGAQLNKIPHEYHTPLTFAVDYNKSPMIALLLPYEKDKPVTDYEQQKRINLIYKLLSHQNFESIKLFLSLKLLTANQIFNTFIQCGKPDKEFLQYLIDNGASYYNNALTKTIKLAFPNSNNNHIQMTSDLADCGAFNSWGLQEICNLEKKITAIREQLEKNKLSGSSEK